MKLGKMNHYSIIGDSIILNNEIGREQFDLIPAQDYELCTLQLELQKSTTHTTEVLSVQM